MKTILLVDDSKTFQRVLENTVNKSFQVVGKAFDGNEGFEQYKILKPQIVLLDITMPNCSGKECLQKILQFDPLAVVIMVSGIGDEGTIGDCLALGAKGFVKKEEVSINISATQSVLVKTITGAVAMSSAEAA